MPASSTLVNTAESAELRLVHILGDHDATSPFVLSCENYIANADATNLLQTILTNPSATKILMKEDEESNGTTTTTSSGADGAFSLLAALLSRIDDELEVKRILDLMIQTVEEYPSEGSGDEEAKKKMVELKMNMLSTIYNLRPDASEKCNILGRILSLCAFSDVEDLLLDLLPGKNTTLGTLLEGSNLEKFLPMNDLTMADKRTLYSVASKVIGKVRDLCTAKSMDTEVATLNDVKQTFMLKLLATFTEAELNEESKTTAIDVAVGAIRDPVSLLNEQRGILSLPPIKVLEKDNATKSLYSLLQIFQEGKLEDFQSFLSTSESTLSKYNLSKDECIRHMRLLSLCSLAAEHEEIPYDAIATTLQVPSDEVESWVITGVSSGLLSAKMDQLQHVVMVERSAVRKFDFEEWKILKERLDVWKKNVKGVLDGLKQSQISKQ